MKRLVATLTMFIVSTVFAAEAVPAESRSTQLDGLKIHYTNRGGADATVVFVHGWSCDESVWNGQAAVLAEAGVRTITIDLPSHGESEKPEIAYSMHLYARAIDAVLRDAKVRNAVIVGHSNGTPAIRQFYREFPASVSALIIVDRAPAAL